MHCGFDTCPMEWGLPAMVNSNDAFDHVIHQFNDRQDQSFIL